MSNENLEKLQEAGISASWEDGVGTFEFDPESWAQSSTVPFLDAAKSETDGHAIRLSEQRNKTITVQGTETGFSSVCGRFSGLLDHPDIKV